MNLDTGELFDNREDALKEAMLKGMSEIEAKSKIMSLDQAEYDELRGMNRAERRQWVRKNKRGKNYER